MADPPRAGAGGLWSFANGTSVKLLDAVTISNGLCWSSNGSTLFYIDTPTQRIDAFDYDVETGAISNRRAIVMIPEDAGSLDGMTIDDDDGLWVAMWGKRGASLRRRTPRVRHQRAYPPCDMSSFRRWQTRHHYGEETMPRRSNRRPYLHCRRRNWRTTAGPG